MRKATSTLTKGDIKIKTKTEVNYQPKKFKSFQEFKEYYGDRFSSWSS